MTIRAGEPWGEVTAAPSDAIRLGRDADIAAWVAVHRDADAAAVVVTDGDLFRAVGGTPGFDRSVTGADIARLPCDALRVVIDDTVHWAVAHVVVRRPLLGSAAAGWWRGRLTALMNVQYLGEWDVAPRAHPNDGWIDVVEVDAAMGVRDRYRAARRLPLGTHVPHPLVRTRRARTFEMSLDRGERVWIDGLDRGGGTRLEVVLEPDVFAVHV